MKQVTVRVHEPLNLEQCQKVLATVLGKAGHPHCYSGINLSFENAVDPGDVIMTVQRSTQNVVEVGG